MDLSMDLGFGIRELGSWQQLAPPDSQIPLLTSLLSGRELERKFRRKVELIVLNAVDKCVHFGFGVAVYDTLTADVPFGHLANLLKFEFHASAKLNNPFPTVHKLAGFN